MLRPRSLTWRLVGRLAGLQAIMLTLLILLIGLAAIVLLRAGLMPQDYEGSTIDTLKDAIVRGADGLALRKTADLSTLRSEHADLWFVIRDTQGNQLSEGTIPQEFAPIAAALDHVNEARLRWNAAEMSPPSGLVKWVDTAAGRVQILTGTYGQLSIWRAMATTPLLFFNVILPIIVLMTLATLVATPFVVRRTMRGLGQAAAQAERIDIDQRGVQLPLDEVPIEITPLVRAINDALGRLDKGYERHKRFLGDAAHELRTPIAILQTRLESLPQGADKTRLLEDVARLSILAEQLLDIQRLDQHSGEFVCVDLVVLGQRVAADLAPLAIAAGYEMSFEPEVEHLTVMGDPVSLERALTNLVQNAIQHGGRRGTITIRVENPSTFAVMDEGPGIPIEHRERIFEPFHRLQQHDRGAGLGLNLVQEIARRHNGHVAVVDRTGGGAYFRMSLSA